MKKSSRKELMLRETFWSLIAITRDRSDHPLDQLSLLRQKLRNLTQEEILGFDYWLQESLRRSYRPDWWATAHVALGGCSDDAFEYFRGWVISRGRQVFEAALDNPDALIGELARLRAWTDAELPEMRAVAWCAFREKTGEDYPEAGRRFDAALRRYAPEETAYPDIHFNWKPEVPESLQRICPRVFAHFYQRPLV
jgi:hypothetical protein